MPPALLLRVLRTSAVGSIFLLSLPACDPVSSAASGAPKSEIQDLMTALTPPPATEIPTVKSEWHLTRKRTLERLRSASRAHGLEALRVYREEPPALPEVRAGLLDVAAHTAPEESAELLVELTTTFGEELLVRTRATELLGECLSARAALVLEPILHGRADGRTYPPEERMLDAWVTAMERLELDPVPLLALIATDIQRAQDVRHSATRALGRHDSPQSRQALHVLLVESTGNGYIRRLALQSLRELLPRAEFCELAKTVQSREADTEFIEFLESALNRDCR
jgi:HEAT repeat protein